MLSIEPIVEVNRQDFFDSIEELSFSRLMNAEASVDVRDCVMMDNYLVFALRLGSKSLIKYGLSYIVYREIDQGVELIEIFYEDDSFIPHSSVWSAYWILNKFGKYRYIDIEKDTYKKLEPSFDDACSVFYSEQLDERNYRVYDMDF